MRVDNMIDRRLGGKAHHPIDESIINEGASVANPLHAQACEPSACN